MCTVNFVKIMKPVKIIFIALVLFSSSCSVQQKDSLQKSRKEIAQEKQKRREMEEKFSKLTSGEYLPNKKIGQYLGVWESLNKDSRFEIDTRKERVVKKHPDGTFFINAEFDFLLVKPLYLIKDSVKYDHSYFKTPIVFNAIIGNDDTYYTANHFMDPIYNRGLKAFIFMKKDQSLELLIDRTTLAPVGEQRTIFPMGRSILVKVKD